MDEMSRLYHYDYTLTNICKNVQKRILSIELFTILFLTDVRMLKMFIYLERGIDIQGTLTVRTYSDIILKNEMLEENFVPKGIAVITF
jgi:hypothetical protein